MMRRPRRPLALALALLALGGASRAARTRAVTVDAEALARGVAEGVAISSDGGLAPAPRLTALAAGSLAGDPAQVFAAATDPAGNLLLGTGPEGKILRVTAKGRSTVLFTVDEPLVTALALMPGGDLLAAAAPGGTIYRVDAEGKGVPWCETGRRYVWALSVDPAGTVFAATGERGGVLRIDATGRAEPFFDSEEPHVVALRALPQGELIAGASGHGVVYLIDRDGNGQVLHEDDLEEVVGLVPGPGGDVWAAFQAAPRPERRPPALLLRLPDGVQVAATDDRVAGLEEAEGPTLRGEIEGLPPREERPEARPRGRVLRISPRGGTTEVWRSTREAPYALAPDGTEGVLFGTGEPAGLYRVDRQGLVSRLATLREAQTSALLPQGRALLAVTSNPVAVYRTDQTAQAAGQYTSAPFDAGGPARWGSIGWSREASEGAELYTRTGNRREPDATWSAWSPALSSASGSPIVNPDGRYLQWRLRLPAGTGAGARVAAVRVSYEPYNRPPEARRLRQVERGAEDDGVATFALDVRDEDGDTLGLRLEARRDGEAEWAPVGAAITVGPSAGDEPDETWRDARVRWDTGDAAEGRMRLRARVDDEAANAPGEGSVVTLELPEPFAVDRTAPRIDARRAEGGDLEIVVHDDASPLARLELLEDGRVLFTLRPLDGVCDAPEESFRLPAGESGARRVLRGTDVAGNAAELRLGTP